MKQAEDQSAAVMATSFPLSLEEPNDDEFQDTLRESKGEVRDEESEETGSNLHRYSLQDPSYSAHHLHPNAHTFTCPLRTQASSLLGMLAAANLEACPVSTMIDTCQPQMP